MRTCISNYNRGQMSYDKFTLLGLLRTSQLQILPHLPNLAPLPYTMLITTTFNFF